MTALWMFSNAASSNAASPPPPADSLNDLFAVTCMKHFYSREQLKASMNAPGIRVAPQEQSEFFLRRAPGTAWFVPSPSTTYVVALRDDGVCIVYAQTAEASKVKAGFVDLVGRAPAPMESREQAGLGPNDDRASTVAYTWSRPQDESELLFVLTTSESPDVTAQAMASMSLVGRVPAKPSAQSD